MLKNIDWHSISSGPANPLSHVIYLPMEPLEIGWSDARWNPGRIPAESDGHGSEPDKCNSADGGWVLLPDLQ